MGKSLGLHLICFYSLVSMGEASDLVIFAERR
jgi:hypothetical protein